jgi:hypothetical protein
MGFGLFHYFTNGLTFHNEQAPYEYIYKITVIHPDSGDISWLSVIKKGETKTYTVNYDDYDIMPSGKYHVFFTFPGLSVKRQDLGGWRQCFNGYCQITC